MNKERTDLINAIHAYTDSHLDACCYPDEYTGDRIETLLPAIDAFGAAAAREHGDRDLIQGLVDALLYRSSQFPPDDQRARLIHQHATTLSILLGVHHAFD